MDLFLILYGKQISFHFFVNDTLGLPFIGDGGLMCGHEIKLPLLLLLSFSFSCYDYHH
jgi:hypothetical protein